MAETKPWYKSQTIWAVVVAVLATFAPEVVEALGGAQAAPGSAADLASKLAAVAAAGFAVYRRVTATASLGKPPGGE